MKNCRPRSGIASTPSASNVKNMFEDREDAGRQLAEKLEQYRGTDAVVLALPRGGVVLGAEIAKALHLPLDIVVTRKIGHPDNPEYAICAVDENGSLLCNETERKLAGEKWFQEEVEREQKEAARRTELYRGGRAPRALGGRIVIISDDGIATGLTIRLAVQAIKKQKPERIVVAVPVAPGEVVRELKKEADELVVLLPPAEFMGAVGAHYQEFEQVDDDTVIQLLQTPREHL